MRFLLIVGLLLFANAIFAQDTFYVKKSRKAEVARPSPVVWEPENTDSIVSYTVEFQKPGTNIWVVLHESGPRLGIPLAAYGPNGTSRVYFKDIIAVDSNGRKYKQPDRLWKGGVWVTLDKKPGET